MTPTQEQALQFQVYEVPPGSWKDITTSKDVTANIICGEVNHLTDFAVMSPTGGTESITVVAPNGNETWQVGTQYEIKWTSANLTGPVKIEYSIDGNATHLNVINSTNNDGSYMWTVPNTPSTQCVIIIWDATDGTPADISDVMFTISSGGGSESVTVTTPNGGESLQGGFQFGIQWTSSNLPGPVYIEYSTDGGSSYSDIITSTTNNGAYLWTVPYVLSQNCRVKISDATDGDPFDVSDADFSISSNLPPVGGGIIVSNADDSGTGSFRDAILLANTHVGMDTILFNIPKAVPGYDSDTGVWIIEPQSALPAITDAGLLIDGFSQAAYIGEDVNPNGPEIQITGLGAGDGSYGIHIKSSLVDILGISINHFSGTGIYVEGAEGGRISGCYVGPNFWGDGPAGNTYGIILSNGTRFFHVAPADTIPNVISGNDNVGVMVTDSSFHNVILANIIGLDKNRMYPIPNGNHGGIMISDKSDSNEVIDNTLCGNAYGIIISGSNENFIANNHIGTYHEWEPFGNENDGVFLADGAQHNLITENKIGYNRGNGIRVSGNQTLYNTITHNLISVNEFKGIENSDGGNGTLVPPLLTIDLVNNISGTAPPNSTIEIFTDPEDEGRIFHDVIMSDGSGNFFWAGSIESPFINITATATDVNGNTSEFSTPAIVTSVNNRNQTQKPESFVLFQNYPNPFNPETVINFDIPQNAYVTLKIYNLLGEEVTTLLEEDKPSGSYSISWSGRDYNGNKVAAGIYLYELRADNFVSIKKMISMK